MASRADRFKKLNEIDASNVEFCEMLTSSHKLEDFFPDEPYLVSIFKNYRSRKLNELTMFWCFLVTFMHWSCETKLFDKEQADYINLNLYGILRGNSVSHKSGYIKPIRKAFDFVEQYFRTQLTDYNNKFITTCIESLTPARLLAELEQSSKFISSDEDRPLSDFAFFEPSLPKAKEAQTCLISSFNGAYKVQRSTMTYSKDIRDKSLTMLVPTTGDRWPSLLEYFSESFQTNGLYERILYWVIGKKNFVHEDASLDENLPCLEYLYVTRMLIGNRVYEYEEDAINYLRPILYKMRHNGPSDAGLFSIPKNKRAEACERRGADLVERIAVIVQNIFDTLKVLEPITSINFSSIKKETLNEIKVNIGNYFYSNEALSQKLNDNSIYSPGVDLKDLSEVQITTVNKAPSQSMKVGLPAVKIAVNLFHKLLLPQSIQLFCADASDNKKIMLNELKIIKHPLNCFSICDLTYASIFHNHKRDNIDVKQLLSNLEKNRLVKCGKFIKSSFRLIESWIKVLPDPTNDEEVRHFKDQLNNTYQLGFEQYLHLYQEGVDDKSRVTDTAHNVLSTQRSWLDELKKKDHDPSVRTKSSETTTDLFASSRPIQPTTLCTNIVPDIINWIEDETAEPIDIIQDTNVRSLIEDSVESTTKGYPTAFTNNFIFPTSVPNCPFDNIEQATAESASANGQFFASSSSSSGPAIPDSIAPPARSIADSTASRGQPIGDSIASRQQLIANSVAPLGQSIADSIAPRGQLIADPIASHGQSIPDSIAPRGQLIADPIASHGQSIVDPIAPHREMVADQSSSHGESIIHSDSSQGPAIVDPITSHGQWIADPVAPHRQMIAAQTATHAQSIADPIAPLGQLIADQAASYGQSIADSMAPHRQLIADETGSQSQLIAHSIAPHGQGIGASLQGQNDTVSPPALLTAGTSMSDQLVTENMKLLCKKVLLTDSIILTSTKLNRISRTNMVDVHKACHLLIENGLLTKEKKMLANKSSYHECYLKRIAYDKPNLVDFSLKLAKFGIVDVDAYYSTLKTVDTKNTTYLSPHGLSILEAKPYSDLKIIVNKNAVIQPLKERCCELSDASDVMHVDKENLTSEKADGSTNIEQSSEPCMSNSKRRRELTSKAKEYKDDQLRSKRKKN